MVLITLMEPATSGVSTSGIDKVMQAAGLQLR